VQALDSDQQKNPQQQTIVKTAKNVLPVMFVVVTLDILGFSLLLPVLPYYAAEFGATPSVVGLLSGAYALCQLVGAPVMARLSDYYGRKPMFLLDIAGSIVGFLVLGMATHLWMFFVSRIVAGFVAANVPIAQAYISDVSTMEERSRSLGVIGAAFGVGFTIGPVLGGLLAKSLGYAFVAFVSAGCAAVNLLVVALIVRESLPVQMRQKQHAHEPAPTLRQRWTAIQTLLHRPVIRQLLVFWSVFSLALAVFQQNIALFNQYHLHLTARQTGMVFATIGVCVSLTQGFALRLLTSRYGDVQLVLLALPVFTGSLALWAFTNSLQMMYAATVPFCVGGSVLITITNSMLTKYAATEETGGMMGIAAAIDNATRVVGSLVGGVLIQHIGGFAPGALAALSMLVLIYVFMSRIQPTLETTPAANVL